MQISIIKCFGLRLVYAVYLLSFVLGFKALRFHLNERSFVQINL